MSRKIADHAALSRLVRAWNEGVSLRDLADRFEVGTGVIELRLHEAAADGMVVRPRSSSKPRGIAVPWWVPADLHAEYREIAAKNGEEAAASHVRRLKLEMTASQ